jgi:hypothetical protein
MKILILILFAINLIYCNNDVLYQISTRPWLYELAQKYKTNTTYMKLINVPDSEYIKLKNSGVNIIWFMGGKKTNQIKKKYGN